MNVEIHITKAYSHSNMVHYLQSRKVSMAINFEIKSENLKQGTTKLIERFFVQILKLLLPCMVKGGKISEN